VLQSVGICYRTPTEKLYDIDIHAELRKMLQEVADRNFMLMGDFNYRNINWKGTVCVSSASAETKMFMECVPDMFLTQHVKCLTTDRSVLDLALSKEPDLVYDVNNLGRFANSDHYRLKWDVNLQNKECNTTRTGFNYRVMNVQGTRDRS